MDLHEQNFICWPSVGAIWQGHNTYIHWTLGLCRRLGVHGLNSYYLVGERGCIRSWAERPGATLLPAGLSGAAASPTLRAERSGSSTGGLKVAALGAGNSGETGML